MKKILLFSFIGYLLFRGGQKVVEAIIGNIEIETAIKRPRWVNGAGLTEVILTVTNNNPAGVEIEGITDGRLYYGTYDLGAITMPPEVYTLGAAETVEITVQVITPPAVALTSIAALLLDQSWFNALRIEGYLVTSAGSFSIAQNISLA